MAALLLVLSVAAAPAWAQSIPRPKILTGHLAEMPAGRFPNGVYYQLFHAPGLGSFLTVENKSESQAEDFTVWIAAFNPSRSLAAVLTFMVYSLGAGDKRDVRPEAPLGFWNPVGVTTYRVAQWESIVEDSPNPQTRVELTAPVRGTMAHSTAAYSIAFGMDPEELGFVLENKGARPIRIVWDETSFIDGSGRTHRVMHVGVRYADRAQPMPPTMVPPGSRVEDIILPVSYVEWSGGRWTRKPLYHAYAPPDSLGVFLSLRVGDQPVEVTYRFGFGKTWPAYVTGLFGR